MSADLLKSDEFTGFVKEVEAGLQRALVARYGLEVGREAAAEALAYAWEHWDRVAIMGNPAGYLYRVGCSRSRWFLRPRRWFADFQSDTESWVEPGLEAALARLSARQRTAVLLVHSFEFTHSEAADLMDIAGGTLRKHLDRGMRKLRAALEVDSEI